MPLKRTPPKKTELETDLENTGGFLSDSQVSLGGVNVAVSRFKRKRDSELNEFMEEIKKAFSNFTKEQNSKLKNLESTLTENSQALKEIQQTNRNIEESMSFMSAQYEEFKNKILHLEEQIVEDRKYISVLENKLEDLQRDSRKTNLEIKNVPKKPNESKEDLINMVICLSKTIDCPITKGDIKDTYRVRGKTENAPASAVVVETSSTIVKNDIQRMCKAFNVRQKSNLCAKHLGLRTAEDTPIFVTEQLTPRAARLHFRARELKRSGAFKYCWTSYGKVYLRKEDNSRVILINNEAQIDQLTKEK